MSTNISSIAMPTSASDENDLAVTKAMGATMRKQRLQDFLFHKVTFTFGLGVLLVLVGIIISLIIGAWPAFHEFGPSFITRVELDPVNNQYVALVAIVGTRF